MITDAVIQEIYRKYESKKGVEDSELQFYIELLSAHHDIKEIEAEVFINSLENTNAFRRFLKRALLGIVEFDKDVALVFQNHILFLSKESDDIRIHIRLSEDSKPSFFKRLFGNITDKS